MERSQVTWGTTTIPYEIRRSARRATVALSIDPVGSLLVTAPETTPLGRLDEVVRAKARWVVERLKANSAPPPPRPSHEFVSGETFLYLGRQYRLRVLPEKQPAPMRLVGGWLMLPVPEGLAPTHHPTYAKAALVDWYKRAAAARLPDWTLPWADRLGVQIRRVLVSDQEKRWGSCAAGTLRFNWRIVQAPRALVDYVLAHEVTHMLHEDHSREFWAALGRLMPDYDERKQRLKELGGRLVW